MGVAERRSCPMPDPAPFPADGRLTGASPDPYPRRIGAGRGLALPILPNAVGHHRLAVPAFEPEHPIGFRDRMPAFDIGERLAPLLTRLDDFLTKLAREQPHLR